VLLPQIHSAFPLVVDTCVLQLPISTLGETASASQVLLKGPVVRACWCTIRIEPWVCPYANKHIGENGLQTLSKKDILRYFDKGMNEYSSVFGKHKGVEFSLREHMALGILDMPIIMAHIVRE